MALHAYNNMSHAVKSSRPHDLTSNTIPIQKFPSFNDRKSFLLYSKTFERFQKACKGTNTFLKTNQSAIVALFLNKFLRIA